MKVIAIGSRFSGVSYHRLFLPLSFMKKENLMMTDQLDDKLLANNYDVMIINRFIHNVELDQIIEARKKYGFKLIVDIDDFWELDEWHVLKWTYPVQKIIDHIKIADHVICTNERLMSEIMPLNKSISIIPNALPYGYDQFTDVKSKPDDLIGRVNFVYAAGVTHERDVAILRNPMKRVFGDVHVASKSHFTICGYHSDNDYVKGIWDRMVSDYTCGLKLSCNVKHSLPVDQYMNFYNSADAIIVPLVDTKFNGMKSNLKLLEAATKKIPAIASNVEPYTGCPAMLAVNKQSDWFRNIKAVATNEQLRIDFGMMLFEWADQYHNLFKWNEFRVELFNQIIESK